MRKKMNAKVALILLLSGLTIVSCKKENLINADTENHTSNVRTGDGGGIEDFPEAFPDERTDIFEGEIAADHVEYMASLPDIDEAEVYAEIDSHIETYDDGVESEREEVVWGIGYHNRIYRWNEDNQGWDEPDPDARLRWVDVASGSNVSGHSPAVWGVGITQRVYQWNETNQGWDEPNPSVRLRYVSALSDQIAVGIGNDGELFITTNGGSSWGRMFPAISGLKWVSISSMFNIYAINSSGSLEYLPYSAGTWQSGTGPGTTLLKSVSAGVLHGAWTTRLNWKIHFGYTITSFWEPNINAGLVSISALDAHVAWGIGGPNADRIFRTSDQGISWAEPDPDARLLYVSVGYGDYK